MDFTRKTETFKNNKHLVNSKDFSELNIDNTIFNALSQQEVEDFVCKNGVRRKNKGLNLSLHNKGQKKLNNTGLSQLLDNYEIEPCSSEQSSGQPTKRQNNFCETASNKKLKTGETLNQCSNIKDSFEQALSKHEEVKGEAVETPVNNPDLDILGDTFQCIYFTQEIIDLNKIKVKEKAECNNTLQNLLNEDTFFNEESSKKKDANAVAVLKEPKGPHIDQRDYCLEKNDVKGAIQSDFSQFLEDTQVLKQLDSAIINNESTFLGNNSATNKSHDKTGLFDNNTQFSQLLSDTQIINELDTVVHHNLNSDVPNSEEMFNKSNTATLEDQKDVFKVPNIHLRSNRIKICKDEPNSSTLDLFDDERSTIKYRQEVDNLFEQIEHSICLMGTDQSQKVIPEKVLDVIFCDDKTEENNAHRLSISQLPNSQSLADINWSDESLMDVGLNASIGTALKQAFLENVNKTQKALNNSINISITENKPVFHNLGPFYGLPLKVKDMIRHYKNIEELYDWQDECLRLPAIEARKNLIYALPTSGGKTLVAEILMLKELMCYKRNALFVLPFVAIVQEKVWALSPFAVALDFLVEEYAASKGTYPPRKRRRKQSIYIATIEKALGLVNSLIETGRLSELGLIIVDELHLVGEEGRGSTLEALLTKLMILNANIHIVGMSATIGNINDIKTFLNADVYMKNFRPVELIEYVKCGSDIAKINWSYKDENDLVVDARKLNFKYSAAVSKLDPDMLGGLVMEVIPKESCLIFCASKKNCENVAFLLCKIINPTLKEHLKTEKEQLLHALKDESGALCSILEVSVQFGIAYHHSGLTSDERRIIEDGFRAGIISVICCTSTLAAGVNLPAKRVILRSPYIGRDFINMSRYKQMVGRAGRAGLGEAGDSILICNMLDMPKVKKLLMSPMDQALSGLHLNEAKGLRHLLLSCVSLGMANTRSELLAVTKATLMAVQTAKLKVDVKKLTDNVIKSLFKLGAIDDGTSKKGKSETASLMDVSVRLETSMCSAQISQLSENSPSTTRKKRTIVLNNQSKLLVSTLGSAAIKGGLELSRAHMLYEDLLQAQESLVLLDHLHLLYLVTPYDMSEQIRPNKQVFYDIFNRLGPTELHTAKIIGVTESVAVKLLSNLPIRNVPEKVLNRFYLALLLYDLWNEMPVFQAAEKFQIDRGVVQNLMTNSSSFATNVVNFCEELEEFWAFSHLLRGLSQRLSHCCMKGLLPLMELPAVKQSRAKQLYNAGYKTLQSIAKANPDDLVEKIEFMSRRVASQLISASKMLLLEKVENLREEAVDILDGVENPQQFFNQTTTSQ